MGSLWESKVYIKSQKYLFRKDLDLPKEELWVSVGQEGAKLQAVKVGGLKKILPREVARGRLLDNGIIHQLW